MRDATKMAEQLGEEHLIGPFRSTDHVVRVHDRLAVRLNRQQITLQLEFPPPPIDGTSDIVPVTTLQMLYEEGTAQRNCAVSRAHEVAKGRAYVYRVLSPERATLQLDRSGRHWCLGEIKAAGNAPVRNETMDAVADWLASRPNTVSLEWEAPF